MSFVSAPKLIPRSLLRCGAPSENKSLARFRVTHTAAISQNMLHGCLVLHGPDHIRHCWPSLVLYRDTETTVDGPPQKKILGRRTQIESKMAITRLPTVMTKWKKQKRGEKKLYEPRSFYATLPAQQQTQTAITAPKRRRATNWYKYLQTTKRRDTDATDP